MIDGASDRDERALRALPHRLLDKNRPIGRAARLTLVVAVIGLALASGIPMCPFAILTRHPCPGCGLTRATFALLRGDVAGATHFHPLVFLITPVVAVMLTYNAVSYVRGKGWAASERIRGRWVTAAWIVLGVLTLTVWIARFFGAFGGPVPV